MPLRAGYRGPATISATTPTTAGIRGPRWGKRADDWARFAAGHARPAWEAVADVTGVGPCTSVLDLGCGSGEFCALAAARGAATSGIDAAEGMIAVARGRVVDGDLRVGPIETLPWDDDRFDVVTAFNGLQFAADRAAALAEAARVTRPGGRVAICTWGRPEDDRCAASARRSRSARGPVRRGRAPPLVAIA